MLSRNAYGTGLGENSFGPPRGGAIGPSVYSVGGVPVSQSQFGMSNPFYNPYSRPRFFQNDDGDGSQLRMQSHDMMSKLYPGSNGGGGMYGDFLHLLMNSGRMGRRPMPNGGLQYNNQANVLGMMGGGT